MILGFKPQFLPLIENGTKIHTIRRDEKRRWKPGMKIHFATGTRTKNYKQFRAGICTGVQDIEIKIVFSGTASEGLIVKVDGRNLNRGEIIALARRDGFPETADFYKWFERAAGPGGTFTGRLIHWTDRRY